MAEALIFAAAEIVEIGLVSAGLEGGAIAFIEGTTFAGTAFAVSNVTLVQGGLALAASIGLAYAVGRPNLPKPGEGSEAVRQPIPARIRGYHLCRLAGATMFFASPNGVDAFVTNALHHGPIEKILALILDDEYCTTTPGLSIGDGFGLRTVDTIGTKMFEFVQIDIHNATIPGTVSGIVSPIVGPDFRGDNTVHLNMNAVRPASAEDFASRFPRGMPKPSVIAYCSPVRDYRDPAQSNPALWTASANPVLQLIDYLTLVDGGCGYDLDEILPPARLAQWMEEADLCDVDLGGGDIRYRSAGWYRLDNNPEDVINHILSTCDGWMDEVEGELVLKIGVFREPTLPPITEEIILLDGVFLSYGVASEKLVNQLDIAFTDPSNTLKWAENHMDSVRDEASILETGITRTKPLDLTWVLWRPQGLRLGERALLRANARRTGSFRTNLKGSRYRGERWVKLQYPSIAALADCVIEIQRCDVNLLEGYVAFDFILVDPVALAAL